MASSRFVARIFLLFLCCLTVLATSSEEGHAPPTHLRHQIRALASSPTYKSQNATADEIFKANKLIQEAIVQQGIYNTHRVENPLRNSYASRGPTQSKSAKIAAPVRPTLNITLLNAAKLIAERDAAAQHATETLHKIYNQPKHLPRTDAAGANGKRDLGTYWLEEITHTGRSPMGGDPSYKV